MLKVPLHRPSAWCLEEVTKSDHGEKDGGENVYVEHTIEMNVEGDKSCKII